MALVVAGHISHLSCSVMQAWFQPVFSIYNLRSCEHWITQIPKTIGSTSIRYRYDTTASDWYVIDNDPRAFATRGEPNIHVLLLKFGSRDLREQIGAEIMKPLVTTYITYVDDEITVIYNIIYKYSPHKVYCIQNLPHLYHTTRVIIQLLRYFFANAT